MERDIRVWNSKTYIDKPIILKEDRLIKEHRKYLQSINYYQFLSNYLLPVAGGTSSSTLRAVSDLSNNIPWNGEGLEERREIKYLMKYFQFSPK